MIWCYWALDTTDLKCKSEVTDLKRKQNRVFFSVSFHHKLNVYDIEQSSHKQEQNCNAKITKNKNNSLSERLTTAMTTSNTFTLKPLINHYYKLNHPKNKQRPRTICRENTLKLNPSHIQCKIKDTTACTCYTIGLLAQTALTQLCQLRNAMPSLQCILWHCLKSYYFVC